MLQRSNCPDCQGLVANLGFTKAVIDSIIITIIII